MPHLPAVGSRSGFASWTDSSDGPRGRRTATARRLLCPAHRPMPRLPRLRNGMPCGRGVRQASGSSSGADRAELPPPVFIPHRSEPHLPPFASVSASHRCRGAARAFLPKLRSENSGARVGVVAPVRAGRPRKIDACRGAGVLFFSAGSDLCCSGQAPRSRGPFCGMHFSSELRRIARGYHSRADCKRVRGCRPRRAALLRSFGGARGCARYRPAACACESGCLFA